MMLSGEPAAITQRVTIASTNAYCDDEPVPAPVPDRAVVCAARQRAEGRPTLSASYRFGVGTFFHMSQTTPDLPSGWASSRSMLPRAANSTALYAATVTSGVLSPLKKPRGPWVTRICGCVGHLDLPWGARYVEGTPQCKRQRAVSHAA